MRTARRWRPRRTSGFTLIETMIVLLYMGIIALIVLPRISGAGRQATETNFIATLRETRAAVSCYQAELGVYPCSLDDIVTDECPAVGLNDQGIEVPIFEQDFHGPYLVPSGGRLPIDRTTGERTWYYETRPPNVGRVRSLSTGISIDGRPYSQF